MLRVWLLALPLIAALGCTPALAPAAAAPPQPAIVDGPPPAEALQAASTVMSQLTTLRELMTSRTFRNDEPFLTVEIERAYVAPDRRYEKMQGRSTAETVSGETVMVGARFFKRVGDNGSWEQFPWTEGVSWPGSEYSFVGVRAVSDGGSADLDGQPARLLLFEHEGTAETRNAGWQFQTRLWIDPKTQRFLRRETRGSHQDLPANGGPPMAQRYEGTWTYLNHNAAITIAEPIAPEQSR